MNSYDIDGVVFINNEIGGLYPGPNDIIITGRSYEEMEETTAMLHSRGIYNNVYYNQIKFAEKTRQTSGFHKAWTLNRLLNDGVMIHGHFEDDEIQAEVIEINCPRIKVIRIVHDLTEKENVRRPFNDRVEFDDTRTPHDVARQRSAAHCDWIRIPLQEALLACDYCLDRVIAEDK